MKCPHCGEHISVKSTQADTVSAVELVLATSVAAEHRGGWAATHQIARVLGVSGPCAWGRLRTLEDQGVLESQRTPTPGKGNASRVWRVAKSRETR